MLLVISCCTVSFLRDTARPSSLFSVPVTEISWVTSNLLIQTQLFIPRQVVQQQQLEKRRRIIIIVREKKEPKWHPSRILLQIKGWSRVIPAVLLSRLLLLLDRRKKRQPWLTMKMTRAKILPWKKSQRQIEDYLAGITGNILSYTCECTKCTSWASFFILNLPVSPDETDCRHISSLDERPSSRFYIINFVCLNFLLLVLRTKRQNKCRRQKSQISWLSFEVFVRISRDSLETGMWWQAIYSVSTSFPSLFDMYF